MKSRLWCYLGIVTAVILVGLFALTGLAPSVFGQGGIEPPARPRGLTTTVTIESVTLTWDDPGDGSITGYQVLRRDRARHDAGEFFIIQADTGSAMPTYRDETVDPGKSYVYRVKAINSAGLSPRSNFSRANIPSPPGAPTGLVASARGDTQVDLVWTAPSATGTSSLTGYRIEFSADGGANWTDLVSDTQDTGTAYSDSGLALGTSRHYRVSAINADGTGPPSNIANASTSDLTPPILTSGVVGASGDSIQLRFSEPLDLDDGRTPAPTAVSVAADGEAVSVGGLQPVGGTEQSIVLTGLTPLIEQGQAVTVSYVDPTSADDTAALQDRSGNDAASFVDRVMANESTVEASSESRSATEEAAGAESDSTGGIGSLLAAKAQRTATMHKLSSHLQGANENQPLPGATDVDQPAGDADSDDQRRASGDTEDEDELVLVDIRADVTSALLERIVELGGTVIDSVPKYRSIRAELPLTAIATLAEFDAVRFIRPADLAVTKKVNTTEGVAAHQVATARTTHAATGAGIGIGVLSNGVRTLAQRQSSGDLPDQVTVLFGQEGEGDEGTAMLEIIHDIAPDAELFFATGVYGQARFAANAEALCAAGADVIVDDIGYLLEAAFQDDIAAQGVNEVAADGCYFFSAAGNDGNLNDGTSGVWEGDFGAGTSLVLDGITLGVVHDFGGGNEANTVQPRASGVAILQWSDPLGASANDYDLFLVDADGNVLLSSTDTQDGTQDPIEYIASGFFSYSGARLVIVKYSGASRYLRLQMFGRELEFATSGSTLGHAAAENAIGVGQVDVGTAGGTGGVFDGSETITRTSSDGPRRLFYEPDGTPVTAGDFSASGGRVLQRPDFVAAACVSTATPGFSHFCGTSAAAPHAAAIGALILEAAGGPKNVTLAQLRTAMTATSATLDIEAAGVDNDSGAGIVMAPGAIDGLDVAVADRNGAPTVTGSLADRSLAAGSDAVTIDLTSIFTDPNSDALTYVATSTEPDRLTVEVSGAELTLTPGSPGRVVVRARSIDPSGLSALETFGVTIQAGSRDYDTDNDGLIDVASLAQLDVIRYDLNGDGYVDGGTWEPYYDAFPMGVLGMGCPNGCTGYELTQSLDFDTDSSGVVDSDDTYWNDGSGWKPIGNPEDPYTGHFSGRSHTVSNLFIDRPTENGVGLFGAVRDESANVSHLPTFDRESRASIIVDVGVLNADVTGHDGVGSLVGQSIFMTVRASYATGSVSGNDRVGGLVGESAGHLVDSYSAVEVSGVEAVGGLVGHHLRNRIEASYATGAVSGSHAVGGLVGAASDPLHLIQASYATGPVSGTGSRLSDADTGFIFCGLLGGQDLERSGGGGVGGLVGSSCGTIKTSYASGKVSGSVAVGGLVGSGGLRNPERLRVISSYWDIEHSGIRVGIGEDDTDANGIIDGDEWQRFASQVDGQSTAQLQAPTDYTDMYEMWNVNLAVVSSADNTPDDPWRFGTSAHLPAIAADLSIDNIRTWQEFGFQIRSRPTLTATTTTGSDPEVDLAWSAVDTSPWTSTPSVSYTVYRSDGSTLESVAKNLSGTSYTDDGVSADNRYSHVVSAVVQGGERTRSPVLSITAGAANQPPAAVGVISDWTLLVGVDPVTLDVASSFSDAEGDSLTYSAVSSDTTVATAETTGSQVTLTPVTAGRATVTITAFDTSSTTAAQRFRVTVGHDYDTDDDGLIDIRTLAQLNALRYNMSASTRPEDLHSFGLAFPGPVEHLGCPDLGCSGYELMADLDFDTNSSGDFDAGDTYWNGGEGWEPIGIPSNSVIGSGGLNVTFEGNGHTIKNLFVARGTYLGLFGGLDLDGVINDLRLENANVTGDDVVGLLVGLNDGLISETHTSGQVRGDRAIGGVVGKNVGTIERSSSTANALRSPPNVNTTTDFVDDGVGGLVGQNGDTFIFNLVRGRIVASYATGTVSGSPVGGLVGNNYATVVASYATGMVTGLEAGGLVGRNSYNRIRNSARVYASYATGSVSGRLSVGGLIGANYSEVSSSYSTGRIIGTHEMLNIGGLVGSDVTVLGSSITGSYWDTTTSGINSGTTTSGLQAPRGYSGIYASWNVDLDDDGSADNPWQFGSSSQYPALSVDFDGDGSASWEEFGYQVRSGPDLTTASGMEQVVLNWTAVDVSSWDPAPEITYTIYRDTAVVVAELDALAYTDSGLFPVTYEYQVIAVVNGGEAARSALVEETVDFFSTNTAPTADATAIPLTVNGRGVVTLDGTASDAENDTLSYQWTSSHGGTFDDSASLDTTWTAPQATAASQNVTLTLTVTDDGEGALTDRATVSIVVHANQAPIVSATASTTTVAGRGSVMLEGTATDPEGDRLTYRWTSSGGGFFSSASALETTWTAPTKTNTAQSIDLTLTVTDNGAGTLVSTRTITVTVLANQAPTASAMASENLVYGRGEVTLTGMASDIDLDALSYKWTSSGGSFGHASALITVWTAPAATNGTQDFTLTLTVTDPTGGSGTAQVSVTVRANQTPMVLATPPSTTINGNESVTLNGTATDHEGDRLSYAWTSTGGGSFASASALDTIWSAPAKTNSIQNIVLTLTVSETGAGGLTDTATVNVTVRANRAPEIDSVDPVNTIVSGGAMVTLDGTASDTDDGSPTYEWSSNGGGSFANDRSLDTTWTAPAATSTEQRITLTLTATDTTMASDTATVQVTVRANQAPEVSVSPESATVGGGSSLILRGRATDPEGGRLTYAWTSDGEGSFANDEAFDTTWTAPAATDSAMSVTLTLTATDVGGVSATATVDVTVPERNNTAPNVSATTLVSRVDGGGTVRLDGEASDPQNDRLTYEWTSNGGGMFVDASALDTMWTAPSAGTNDQDIRLTLTVTDTNNASTTATVTITVRGNQAPRATATGRPSTVGGGGVVTLHGTADDPEDDELTFRWASNGGGVFAYAAAVDTTWTAPPKTSAIQNVLLTLTVTDNGSGALSDTASVAVTVRANQSPTVSVTTSSATVYGSGTLTLNGSANDRDGDSLTYEWRSDSGGAFTDSSELDTSWTAPRASSSDQQVTLTITATDSAGGSAESTVVVTLQRNQPPQVTVSPRSTTVAGDETVELTGRATDLEAGMLSYRWSSNGGGSFEDEFAEKTKWTAPPKTDNAQSITLTFTATDNGAGTLAGSATVEIIVPGNTTVTTVTSGGGGGGGGGGPPPIPVPSDKEFDWNVSRDIELFASVNDLPTGLWSDGTTLWVVENSATGPDAILAYELETGLPLPMRQFQLDPRNRFSHGVWADGETLWIADSGQDRLFAYSLATGQRLYERDLELADRNRDPRGIWSDGETVYVLDSVKDSLFVYELKSGALLAEHPLDNLNASPRGLWSDSYIFWVSDDGAKRLFAYQLEGESLNRIETMEFSFRSLLKAGNGDARGIWSDGDVMFVADELDDKVYTYNMPDAIDARLDSLALAGLDIGAFSPNETSYRVSPGALTQTKVQATAAQSGATVSIGPAITDADAEAGQLVELSKLETILVTVTSPDGSRTRSYRIEIERPACLSGLTETRLSAVQFVGGSIDELGACAQSLSISAFYHHNGEYWAAIFFGAPEFLNRPFRDRFADGLPEGLQLFAKRDSIQVASARQPAQK